VTIQRIPRSVVDRSLCSSGFMTRLHKPPSPSRHPLHRAAALGDIANCQKLLAKNASPGARDTHGLTPLHLAAGGGHADVVRLLLVAGADRAIRNRLGATPADLAERNHHAVTLAVLDPPLARKRAAKIRAELEAASLVHVISTRLKRCESQLAWVDADGHHVSCDPLKTARKATKGLELSDGVRCFDPDANSALIVAAGAHEAVVHPEEARENWEWALSLAARTGGRVIQIVVRPGLSKAQEGEARLAAAKGVAVVQFDCQAVAYFAGGCAHPLDSLSGWTELERLTRRKRGTGKAPLPRPLHRHATLGVCGEVYLYLAVP